MKKVYIFLGIFILSIIIIFVIFNSKTPTYSKFIPEKFDTTMYKVDDDIVTKKLKNKDSFIIFVSTNFCSFSIPCSDIFKSSLEELNISAYEINWNDFKNTKLYKEIKYGPTFIIINNGKIMDYLDANDSLDNDKYQDINVFKEWLLNYINVN